MNIFINENEFDKPSHNFDLMLFSKEIFEFYKCNNFELKIIMQFEEKIK